jgi:hypothetical protein
MDPGFFWFGLGLMALLTSGMALVLPWVPGVPAPDGSDWRMTGWDSIRCAWHDWTMGDPGSPEFQPSLEAWGARLSLEPGSRFGMRGYVDSVIATSNEPEEQERAMSLVLTLWRVARTNRLDVGRALRLAEKMGDGGRVLRALGHPMPQLSDMDRSLLLWLLADEGDWDRVEQMKPQAESRVEMERLVAAALQAVRGNGAGRARALERLLATGMLSHPLRVPANRLAIQVSGKRPDVRMVRDAVTHLQVAGAARLLDLVRAGRVRMAAEGVGKLRKEAPLWGRPHMEREVEPWVEFIDALGMYEWGRNELEWAANRWGRRDWWLDCLERTIRDRDFIALARMGNGLVMGTGPLKDWRSLGHGLLAVSAAEFNRMAESEAAWRKSAALGVPSGWGMRWCEAFARLGRLRAASGWLMRIETGESGSLGYWKLRMRLAREETDWVALLAALKRARELAPNEAALMSEQASVLLFLRQEPEEALRLLEEEAVQARKDGGDRVLLALALVQAGRLIDAERLIELLEVGTVETGARALLQVASFEVHLRSRRVRQAEQAYEKTDLRHVPAPLAHWMESAFQGMKSESKKEPAAK